MVHSAETKQLKVWVGHNPEPDLARTYLHGRGAGTLGVKIATTEGEFGVWEFLPVDATPADVLAMLEYLARRLRKGLLPQDEPRDP